MRDDLKKLPLPASAKAYARRGGLKSMKRQPQDFINVMASITNQKWLQKGFKNSDAGGKVAHAFNEDVDRLVMRLVEGGDDDYDDYDEWKEIYQGHRSRWKVWRIVRSEHLIVWNIQVPSPMTGQIIATPNSGLVNLVNLDRNEHEYAPDEERDEVLARMDSLAKNRDYPPDSVFDTPWGEFPISKQGIIL